MTLCGVFTKTFDVFLLTPILKRIFNRSTLRFTCERQKQLVKMKDGNVFVNNVISTCEEGGKWSETIVGDYKCLGMFNE